MIASAHVCPGQPSCGRLLACWTHNPPVLGSSPSRPTLSESRSDVSDLRKCVGLHDLVCQPRVQLCAARSGEMQVDPAPDHSFTWARPEESCSAFPNRCQEVSVCVGDVTGLE